MVSRVELAELFGRTPPTIDAWVRQGMPFLERGSKGREWRFDSAAAIKWSADRQVADAVSRYADQDGERVSKDEADRRRAVAMAITAEVEADQAITAVVDRADAESIVATFCVTIKSALLSAISKIASRAASVTSAPEIQAICEAEINRAYDIADAELKRKWAAPDEPSTD